MLTPEQIRKIVAENVLQDLRVYEDFAKAPAPMEIRDDEKFGSAGLVNASESLNNTAEKTRIDLALGLFDTPDNQRTADDLLKEKGHTYRQKGRVV